VAATAQFDPLLTQLIDPGGSQRDSSGPPTQKPLGEIEGTIFASPPAQASRNDRPAPSTGSQRSTAPKPFRQGQRRRNRRR